MIAAALGAFLLGSIPFGWMVARIFLGSDLRSQGSGNIGATNVTRVVGFWPAGFITLVLDVLKGAVPVLIVLSGEQTWVPVSGTNAAWVVGFFAVLGHCYSPWLRFNGGKGVATAAGVWGALSPFSALIALLSFFWIFAVTRTVSLASISALLIAAAAHLALQPLRSYDPYLALPVLIAFVIILRHDRNLDDLLEDRENSFL